MSVIKQPSETYVFTIDCKYALSSTTEVIQSVLSSTVSPTGLTISSVAIDGTQKIQPTVTGGTDGVTYKLTFSIQTSVQPSQEVEAYLHVIDT